MSGKYTSEQTGAQIKISFKPLLNIIKMRVILNPQSNQVLNELVSALLTDTKIQKLVEDKQLLLSVVPDAVTGRSNHIDGNHAFRRSHQDNIKKNHPCSQISKSEQFLKEQTLTF